MKSKVRALLGVLLFAALAVGQTAEPLAVGFAFRPAFPMIGDEVQFTDYSKGTVVTWLWEFGDGTTSSERNPKHTYTVVGSYEITLTISDGTQTVSLTRTPYAH